MSQSIQLGHPSTHQHPGILAKSPISLHSVAESNVYLKLSNEIAPASILRNPIPSDSEFGVVDAISPARSTACSFDKSFQENEMDSNQVSVVFEMNDKSNLNLPASILKHHQKGHRNTISNPATEKYYINEVNRKYSLRHDYSANSSSKKTHNRCKSSHSVSQFDANYGTLASRKESSSKNKTANLDPNSLEPPLVDSRESHIASPINFSQKYIRSPNVSKFNRKRMREKLASEDRVTKSQGSCHSLHSSFSPWGIAASHTVHTRHNARHHGSLSYGSSHLHK